MDQYLRSDRSGWRFAGCFRWSGSAFSRVCITTEKLRLSSALAPTLQPPLLLTCPRRPQMRVVRRGGGMGAQRTEVLSPRFSSREPMVHPSLAGRDSTHAVGENDVGRHLRSIDIGRRIGAAMGSLFISNPRARPRICGYGD